MMERLTKRINDVVTYIGKWNSYETGQIAAELNAAARREILERLADYEDTGLTPEEVLPKDKADEIALKIMRLADLESFCSYTRLRELAEAAVERDWIRVEDRLPEEHESIFAKAYGTKRWADGMFRTISDEVLACVAFEDGHKMTMTLRTHDGAWALSSVHRGHVTHWMPLPEPPKTNDRMA